MKRKVLATLLSFLMLFSLVPTVSRAEGNIIATFTSNDGTSVNYTTVDELAKKCIEADKGGSGIYDGTLTLYEDVTLPYTGSSSMGAVGLMHDGILDLNGHTLTITVSDSIASSATTVFGIVVWSRASEPAQIINGTIVMNTSNVTSTPTMSSAIWRMFGPLVLEGVEITASTGSSLSSGVYATAGQADGALTLKNSVINVGSAPAINTPEDSELWPSDFKEPVNLISGSYKNLYNDSELPGKVEIPQGTSNVMPSSPDGIEEGTTVITSEDTTAMVVQDGNAYLYDSLQDAVDVKGQGETETTIQVMKDSKDVINVSPTSNFSLTAFSDNVKFDGGLRDKFGNVVRAGTNSNELPSVSNGILSVPVDGSVTTSDGTVIKGSGTDVPKIGANGDITVPAGGTVTTSNNETITVPAGGVTIGSNGQISGSATSVELDQTSVHLYGNTSPSSIQLNATITPDDSIDTVTWTSSDTSVARVDSTGLVTAVGDGKATITVTVGTHSAECTVTVSTYTYTGDYNYPVTIGKTEHGTVTIAKEDQWANDGEKITVTVTPDDAYMLDELVIKDKAGNELPVKDNGDGTYTFTMPEGAVTITATFVEDPDWVEPEPEEPTPEPSTDVTDIFSDVTPGAWYVDVVQYAYDHGLMTGTSATTFEPDTTTSRAMIVSILHRLEGSPSVGTSDFSDVVSGAWYADPVAWAAENGIVAGFEDGTFGPNDPITREQMASILYRYAEYKGIDTSARADLSAYSDQPSAWAQNVMEWANAEGLINGTTATTLDPQGTATRAQVAAMLQRFIENVL